MSDENVKQDEERQRATTAVFGVLNGYSSMRGRFDEEALTILASVCASAALHATRSPSLASGAASPVTTAAPADPTLAALLYDLSVELHCLAKAGGSVPYSAQDYQRFDRLATDCTKARAALSGEGTGGAALGRGGAREAGGYVPSPQELVSLRDMRTLLEASLQDAWNDYVEDANAHPECFSVTGVKRYKMEADFALGGSFTEGAAIRFVSRIRAALIRVVEAARSSAAVPPEGSDREASYLAPAREELDAAVDRIIREDAMGLKAASGDALIAYYNAINRLEVRATLFFREEVTRLQAEGSEERRDAERLDWLEKNGCTEIDLNQMGLKTWWSVCRAGKECVEEDVFEGKTLRAAIDAAMSRSPSSAPSEAPK